MGGTQSTSASGEARPADDDARSNFVAEADAEEVVGEVGDVRGSASFGGGNEGDGKEKRTMTTQSKKEAKKEKKGVRCDATSEWNVIEPLAFAFAF